ncbi:putative arabinose 5-phosphate isomerase [Hibiscus syriacus]|uniref:Arabinose 5-phosphate isomerase n=1 Tax=Hibiscus syriacus TaxID=106335 RepID=A0A6A2X767_HIBSY|nr:putative arabinose 5-phosphate isomerase [Hibiscus syriacus]
MGSLPLPPDLPSPPPKYTRQERISETSLLNLFKAQQGHLNYFFQNLDLSQALSFTENLLNSRGIIFFSGVGKSGFVANKISQTLVSLGIRSAFLSPLDALHGDIGSLSSSDILGVYLISVTSVPNNALANACDMNVHLPLERELCPFDLAPVTSTAMHMVFGDTVAIALMGARNLSKEQYAANHPAGRIGKSLILIKIWFSDQFFSTKCNFFGLRDSGSLVKDIMKKQVELPVCKEGDLIMDQLLELTSKGCGCLLVIDEEYHLLGTFTDGDLRRTLKASGEVIFKLTVGEMCNRTICPDAMAVEAMQKMESPPSPVQFLPVVDDQITLIGIVTLHGLVSAGL